MLSIDVLSVPTDEAIREVENKLLGVETNITNWQRKQNQNNNFSAVIPYDMELQRNKTKEFLADLTTRDQRMMLGLITIAIYSDSKEQLYPHYRIGGRDKNGTILDGSPLCWHHPQDLSERIGEPQ